MEEKEEDWVKELLLVTVTLTVKDPEGHWERERESVRVGDTLVVMVGVIERDLTAEPEAGALEEGPPLLEAPIPPLGVGEMVMDEVREAVKERVPEGHLEVDSDTVCEGVVERLEEVLKVGVEQVDMEGVMDGERLRVPLTVPELHMDWVPVEEEHWETVLVPELHTESVTVGVKVGEREAERDAEVQMVGDKENFEEGD